MTFTPRILQTISACCLLSAATLAQAAPLVSGLLVEVDSVHDESAAVPHPLPSSAGHMTHTVGGADSVSTIINGTAAPNPLGTDTLTDTGDGLSFRIADIIRDHPVPGTPEAYSVGIDQTATFTNTGAAVIDMSLGFDYLFYVAANFGIDTFAQIFEFSLVQDLNGTVTTLANFTPASDSVFGDVDADGLPLPTFGDVIADSGSDILNYLLNPGDVLTLDVTLSASAADFSLDAPGADLVAEGSIEILSSRIVEEPQPAPVPGVLALMLLPLLYLNRKLNNKA